MSPSKTNNSSSSIHNNNISENSNLSEAQELELELAQSNNHLITNQIKTLNQPSQSPFPKTKTIIPTSETHITSSLPENASSPPNEESPLDIIMEDSFTKIPDANSNSNSNSNLTLDYNNPKSPTSEIINLVNKNTSSSISPSSPSSSSTSSFSSASQPPSQPSQPSLPTQSRLQKMIKQSISSTQIPEESTDSNAIVSDNSTNSSIISSNNLGGTNEGNNDTSPDSTTSSGSAKSLSSLSNLPHPPPPTSSLKLLDADLTMLSVEGSLNSTVPNPEIILPEGQLYNSNNITSNISNNDNTNQINNNSSNKRLVSDMDFSPRPESNTSSGSGLFQQTLSPSKLLPIDLKDQVDNQLPSETVTDSNNTDSQLRKLSRTSTLDDNNLISNGMFNLFQFYLFFIYFFFFFFISAFI